MYFSSKGLLVAAIIAILLSVIQADNHNKTNKSQISPGISLITALIEQFIAPKAGAGISIKTRSKSSTREGTIEWTVQKKITQLKSYLQDDDVLEDKEEQTIIIEFLPKHKQKENNEKYFRAPKNDSVNHDTESTTKSTDKANRTLDVPKDKAKYLKVREKIKSQLEKEAVSDETVDYVLKKVDYLIERLIKSDCTFKSTENGDKLRTQDAPVHLSVKWTKRWDDLKKRYFNIIRDPERTSAKDNLGKAMEEYGKFFSSIIEDVNLMSNVYSLQCKLLKKNTNIERRTMSETAKQCKHFRVCSTELGFFFNDYFLTLNDTITDALRNYAAMYSVDVAADENDSDDDVAKTIKRFVGKTKKTMKKIFDTELGKFTLDKNKDAATNMEHFNSFINNTLQSLKSIMKKNIERTLDGHSDVQEDLFMNINTEIDEFSKVTHRKLCKNFQTCNGNGRRSFGYKSMLEGSDVYVNVRVGINDDRNMLFKSARRRFVNDDKYQATVRSRYIPHKYRIKQVRRKKEKQRNTTEMEVLSTNQPKPIRLNNFNPSNLRSKINLKSLRRNEQLNRRSQMNINLINNDLNEIKSQEDLVLPNDDGYKTIKRTEIKTTVSKQTNIAVDKSLTSKLGFKAHISIDKENAIMELVRRFSKPNFDKKNILN